MAARQGLRLHFGGYRAFDFHFSSSSTSTSICQPCLRQFSTSASAQAGHNKWSKTKHIKAVTDKKKMSDRTIFTKAIEMYSRMYGEDLKFNPQLANAIAAATKASVPKTLVEAAVARGQGRSPAGTQLEPLTFEALVPPNIAIIAEVETDNKNRTIQDLKGAVKKKGGLSSASAFYFAKRGRAVFRAKDSTLTLSDLLEEAIEHDGAEDVEELPEGAFLAWTQPPALMAITKALSTKFNLEILESDIVWAPNQDTMVNIDESASAETLSILLDALKEYTEVKAIYANVRQGSVTADEWERIERNLDV